MLTLNEIRNVNFRKSNFGGYRAEDVEAFIDEVQLSYDALLRENAELVKKLEVLAARLAEYQQEEDSIRNALMNAQKVGDASLRDAKHKAEIILKDATIKAERIVSNAQSEIHREREIIDRMQRDIADFKARLLRAYKDHLTLINNLPTGDILTPETREMSDSVMMLDRRAASPFGQSEQGAPKEPEQRMQPPMPQMEAQKPSRPQAPQQPIPPRNAEQPPVIREQPRQPELRPEPPKQDSPLRQEQPIDRQAAPRKGGFTVGIGAEAGEPDVMPMPQPQPPMQQPQPAPRAPQRQQPRQPRFPASFESEVSMPEDASRLASIKINEDSLSSDSSEASPANLFRRRKQ